MWSFVIALGLVGQFAFSMDGPPPRGSGPGPDPEFVFSMDRSRVADLDRAIILDVMRRFDEKQAERARARVTFATARAHDPILAALAAPPVSNAAPLQWAYPVAYGAPAALPVQRGSPRARARLWPLGGLWRGGGRSACASGGCASY
jgi:hypothetical protein